MHTHRRFGRLTSDHFCILFLVLYFFCPALGRVDAAPALSIENVRIDRTTLRPGEEVKIFFTLNKQAKVSVYVYSPDYEVVRTLMEGQARPSGTNDVSWDGRDASGTMVPDEAYLVGILTEGTGGEKATYDPTALSGGETIDIPVQRLEEASGVYRIHYSLPAPTRVTIRAGIQKGPLLRTIVDAKPLPSGNQVQMWDGWDETGQISIMKESRRMIQATGFLLPRNVILVQGGREDYSSYQRGLRSSAPAPARVGPLSYQDVRKNALSRLERDLSQQFMARQSLNVAPKFRVRLQQDPSSGLAESAGVSVSGEAGLTVDISPESLYAFNESRYEIVVFVDNERFDEEEQAYPSYTYTLDTRRLTNGEHWITINLLSMAGQIGSYSFKVNVSN